MQPSFFSGLPECASVQIEPLDFDGIRVPAGRISQASGKAGPMGELGDER